jgi:nicotinamide-nucleotide amidase
MDDPIVERLTAARATLAVAESLTGGALSIEFAKRPQASQWYRGAVVAYSSEIKHRLLGVRPGPVVSREAALDMAHGVAAALDATVALAVTGVGGPEPQDGQEPGTVWLAATADGHDMAVELQLDGSPEDVIAQACRHALAVLENHLRACRVGG